LNSELYFGATSHCLPVKKSEQKNSYMGWECSSSLFENIGSIPSTEKKKKKNLYLNKQITKEVPIGNLWMFSLTSQNVY
jgi:hypothetical protein